MCLSIPQVTSLDSQPSQDPCCCLFDVCGGVAGVRFYDAK